MTAPVTLALPARVLRLDILVGPPEGVTPLEDLVARGILAAGQEMSARNGGAENANGERTGNTTMEYLVWLFKLPQRVIMEVVGTLWAKGHLTVDFASGGIELSEAARAKVAGAKSLAAEGDLQNRDFIFEPVTGMILSTYHGRGRASETSVRLPLRPELKLSDIPPQELVSSVQAALRNERRRRGRVNVLSVGFGSPIMQSSERILWLEVDAVVRRDPDNERLTLTTSESSGWSLRSQKRLNAFFDRLLAEDPKHPVIQQLSGRAQIERDPPKDLDDLFGRMHKRLGGLSQTDLNQVEDSHKWLSEWATQIEDRLDDVRQAQAKVSLVSRDEGHAWTVNDLIDSARRQIVLVVPDPDPGRIHPFQSAIRRALSRDVQVVFVWGVTPNEQLNSKVENFLDELNLRPGSRLLRNPKSAKTDACLVIQDDSRAMVGSHSILGRRPPGPAEVSVLIEPAENGPDVPMAVADLLRWVKREFAPWVTAQKIEQAEAGPARSPANGVGSALVGPHRPDHPVDPMSSFNPADVDATTLQLWATGWIDTYAALAEARQQITAKQAAVEVVSDAEHRTLLWEGLRDSQYRLVISDDRLSPRSAGTAVARSLRDRRAAGAVVHVLHPDPLPSEQALKEFSGLARGHGAITVRNQSVGGRLFIADDRIVIGSFSPFDDRHGEAAGRRISRLGVRIRHEPLAAEVAGLLGAHRVGGPQAETPALVPAPPAGLPGARSGIALFLEAHAAPEQDFGRIAAERLREHEQPFDVLSSWRNTRVPPSDLRRVAAATLHAGLGAPAPAQTWINWLIEDAWSRGAYVEAALLSRWEPIAPETTLETAQDVAARPDSALRAAALLSATLETGPLTGEMVTSMFELGDSPGARTAGAAALVGDILIWGQADHRELLGLLSGDLSPAWRDLCERIERFGSAPLPLSRFSAAQTRAETVRTMDLKRAEISRSIDRIEALRGRFSFDTGIALHGELFRPGGLLQRIRDASQSGTRECRDLAPHLPHDVRRHLDDVVARTGEKPMEWLKQINFLRRLESLVRDVRAIAASSGETHGEERPDDHSLAETIALGKYLGENWDRLYTEARETGRPYELPALGLLTLLNPLMTWAKEQP